MNSRNRLRRWLIKWAEARAPDFVIGNTSAHNGVDGDEANDAVSDPYLRRWWLIPRNPIFNIYVHQILRSDDDRALHDHPWANCSVVLQGQYREILPIVQAQEPRSDFVRIGTVSRLRVRGNVVIRRARSAHRLEVVNGEPCWTLFITGPRLREWGFRCRHGWRHWAVFTSPADRGRVGRGCD